MSKKRVVITISGGVGDVAETPAGVEVLIVDYDNLHDTFREDVDPDVLAWITANDPEEVPQSRAEFDAENGVEDDSDDDA